MFSFFYSIPCIWCNPLLVVLDLLPKSEDFFPCLLVRSLDVIPFRLDLRVVIAAADVLTSLTHDLLASALKQFLRSTTNFF